MWRIGKVVQFLTAVSRILRLGGIGLGQGGQIKAKDSIGQ